LSDLLDGNRFAAAMVGTLSLSKAEDATRRVCGFSEIDYERDKARRNTAQPADPSPIPVNEAVREFEREAAARGVDLVTFRRIVEASGTSAADSQQLRHHLVTTRPNHDDWPLWSVLRRPVASTGR
jgi:hypothetical protein